jgi:hypothetical protein
MSTVLLFSLDPTGQPIVNVTADRDGLLLLRQQLDFLLSGSESHVHLMSESWGGNELDDGPVEADEVVLHAVNIGLVPPSA